MPKKNQYTKRKDGRFEGKILLGHKENGKPIRKTVYGKTSSEVERKIAKLKYEYENGLYADDKGLTLGKYALDWLATYKSGKETNTKAMYQNAIKKHINAEIGFKQISCITKSDIQRIINNRSDHHRTCEIIRLTLNQIFKSAIDDGLIIKNPCSGIELPKKPHSEKRRLTDIELQAIRTAAFTPREKAFVYIVFGCGLRRGEALALTKADINLKKRTLTINKALAFDVNRPEQKDPKTYSGYREVNMPVFLTDFLADYLKNVDILLFTKSDGGQITKSSYDKMWRSIVRKMDAAAKQANPNNHIDGLTAHIFRHNYCTMLYYSGMSLKKATQLMGHSDIKMITDVYAHLDEEKEKAGDKIDQTIVL